MPSYERMKERYAALGARDQLTAVTELLEAHGTTMQASMTETITSLTMPGYLLRNGLTGAELAALRTRLVG